MSPLERIVRLDRTILEHPQALHIRRMRAAIWLYLDLLARLPAGADTLEMAPADIARAMGLPEGTIRSWLGHLRRNRYVETKRLNGTVRVRVKHGAGPASNPESVPTARFFTAAKLGRTLGEPGGSAALQAAVAAHPDTVIRRALAATLAVPAEKIRRSRTALFLYLLNHHAQHTNDDPRS